MTPFLTLEGWCFTHKGTTHGPFATIEDCEVAMDWVEGVLV